MSIEKERLLSLIEFAQQSARLRSKPVANVTEHRQPVIFEHQLQGLPGISLNQGTITGEDEIWLSVQRLHETNPPQVLSKILQPWVEITQGPNEEPRLKERTDGESLITAGTHRSPLTTESAGMPPIEPREVILLEEYENMAAVKNLFAKFINEQWRPWAEEEKIRRETIRLYSRLFTMKQQLEGGIVEAQLELVWGVGLGIWNYSGTVVEYPLLTQLVELSLNSRTSALEIRPRDVEARLELDWYASISNLGVAVLEKASKEFWGKSTYTFSPFDRATYEPLLRTAATNLDANGIYWPDVVPAEDRGRPKPDEKLKVTDTWVLFARQRTNNVFLQDLETFKKEVDEVSDPQHYPPAVRAIVKDPATTAGEVDLPAFRGVSATYHGSSYANSISEGNKPLDLYFPKPFNDEQVRIVQLLHVSDGVVVQGPPGTGKTHTIANVICHYLAQGKRVLVTSMKDPALAVLQEHLPEEIRPLAISLLTSEQDGMRQFEFAIQKIATEVQYIDTRSYLKDISQIEETIDILHGKLALIDRRIGECAISNLTKIVLDGEEIDPQDAARKVIDNTGEYEWLPDEIGVEPKYAPGISDADVIQLREARRVLGSDIDYLRVAVPQLVEFPDSKVLLDAHQDLGQFEILRQSVERGDVPRLADSGQETLAAAQDLLSRIGTLRDLRTEILKANRSWTGSVREHLHRSISGEFFKMLEDLGAIVEDALRTRKPFVERPVRIPDVIEADLIFLKALDNLSKGKSPFGLIDRIRRSEQKKKLHEVFVVGNHPNGSEDWKHVVDYLAFLRELRGLVIRWNTLSRELGIETLPSMDPESGIAAAADAFALYCKVKNIVKAEAHLCIQAKQIFPDWQNARDVADNAKSLEELQEALSHHLRKYRLSNVWGVKDRFQKVLEGRSGPVVDRIREFLIGTLGNPKVPDTAMQSGWSALMAELSRVLGLRSYLNTVEEICDKLEASGAPMFAQLLRKPVDGAIDKLLPDNWRMVWRLKRLATHLDSIDGQEELKKLARTRHDVENDLSKSYRDIVVKRTWLKLTEKASPSIRSALQAYLTAIQKIGKGTGKRAVRYRRDARVAASQANPAVPCWIMRHDRVSESLPATLGCFDLVIIDEASQSDLTALPSLLRAEKVLIVGDDKQVSPEGVGLEEEKIRNLMNRFLSNQVDTYRPQMSPERSMYDLFKVVFAKDSVMLREHFRCVGPIIEYSKREFYNHELRPLRIPKASERLDPPLIDVVVLDGFRKGDVNPAEARFIVNEIKSLVIDPHMANRSIGVVSLLADKQALAIWEHLTEELGPEKIQKHRITCGDARTFQGKERDIMFLSMVSAPNNVGAPLTRDTFSQRFNVAASRARDRMYLVRSVDPEHLSEADRLRRGLITHFKSPYAQDEARVEDLRRLCESPFEREVYDELTQRGYRVTPQVKVGHYRIDMVVEGANDSRLAIECDGDKYHGPEKWIDDIQRQRTLERAGQVFWRCFASVFIRRRKEMIEDLLGTLNERGVEPIGSEGMVKSVHSEQRRVTSFATSKVEEGSKLVSKADPTIESSIFSSPPPSEGTMGNAHVTGVQTTIFNIEGPVQYQMPNVTEKPTSQNAQASSVKASSVSSIGSTVKELMEFCMRHRLKIWDNRTKGGALWVNHLSPSDEVAEQLKKWGFRLAMNKGYWRKD